MSRTLIFEKMFFLKKVDKTSRRKKRIFDKFRLFFITLDYCKTFQRIFQNILNLI